MALTFRTDKGSALSIQELDNNFRHFTGSHTISGSLTLDQGGVSATLTPENIIALKAGKSILDSSNARGTDTAYLQASSLYDVNDRTSYIQFNDSLNQFNLVWRNQVALNFQQDSNGNRTTTINTDCNDRFRNRGKLQQDCDSDFRGNITASGIISSSEGVSTQGLLYNSNTAKIGENSIIMMGQDTSLMKVSMITSMDHSNYNTDFIQKIFTSGVATNAQDAFADQDDFDFSDNTSGIRLGFQLSLDTEATGYSVAEIHQMFTDEGATGSGFGFLVVNPSLASDSAFFADNQQVYHAAYDPDDSGIGNPIVVSVPDDDLNYIYDSIYPTIYEMPEGYDSPVGSNAQCYLVITPVEIRIIFHSPLATGQISMLGNGSTGFGYIAGTKLQIDNGVIHPAIPRLVFEPLSPSDLVLNPSGLVPALTNHLEPAGTTRILLKAPDGRFSNGLIETDQSNQSVSSILARNVQGQLETIPTQDEHEIEFQTSQSLRVSITNDRTNFHHPIKFEEFDTLSSNTFDLDNPILILDDADNFVKKGPILSDLVNEAGGDTNQNAYSTASFGNAGEIVATSPTSSFQFGFGSGLSGSIDEGVLTIYTSSDFASVESTTPSWNQTLTVDPTATQDAFLDDEYKLHFGTNPDDGESSFIHEYASNLIIVGDDNIHLNPGGFVGIDESSPQEMLDIDGNLKVQGAISASSVPADTSEDTIVVHSGGVLKGREFSSFVDELDFTGSNSYATASFGTAGEVVATSATSSFQFGFGSGLSGSIDSGVLTIYTSSDFSTTDIDTGSLENENAYSTASIYGTDLELVATSITGNLQLEAGDGIYLSTGSGGTILISSSVQGADNLGNHTASLDLNMGGNDIYNATFVYSTSSWANNALTASFVTGSDVYGPYGGNSVISASHAVTASYVATASYIPNLQEVTDPGNGVRNKTTNAITSSGGLEITGSNKFRLLSQTDFVIDNIATANVAEKFALVIDNNGVVKRSATEFGDAVDALGNFVFHVTASDTPDGPFNIIESSSFIFSGSNYIDVTSPSGGQLEFAINSDFINAISGAIGYATESIMPGVHFSSSDGSFSLGILETASFAAAGGPGLSASLADNTVTYTLNGVVSESGQLPGIFFDTSDYSGFGVELGETASFLASGDAWEAGAFNIIVENGVVNYELDGVTLNANTGSLENQNAYGTASIFTSDGDVIFVTASNSADTLQFQFGDNIFAVTSSTLANTIFISGAEADNLGNHIAEMDLQMGDGNTNYNIDNLQDATVYGDIKLLGTNKISFNNNNNGTYIHANSSSPFGEDLVLYSENDILLKPDNNVGINIIGTNPSERLEVGGNVKAGGYIAGAGSGTIPSYRFSGTNSGSGMFLSTIPGSPRVLGLTVDGGATEASLTENAFSTTVPIQTTGGRPITSSGDVTASGLLYASASNANGSFNHVVMYDTGSGRFYYTGSYGGSGGGAASDNLLVLNNNTSNLASLGAVSLNEGETYLRAEFYAKESGSNVIQSARTVFIWDEPFGDITVSTVEDVRTHDNINLFNINSVSGSWDASGDLKVNLVQYNNLTVSYKLRYIKI